MKDYIQPYRDAELAFLMGCELGNTDVAREQVQQIDEEGHSFEI